MDEDTETPNEPADEPEAKAKKKKKNPLEECKEQLENDMNEISDDLFGW